MIEYLSYSSVSLYLTCARAWRFRHIDKIRTPVAAVLPFGSAFHDAIEAYIGGKTLAEPSAVDKIFAERWRLQLEREQNVDFGDESPESLFDLGQHMLSSEIDVTSSGPNRKCRNASVFLNDIVPMLDDNGPVLEKRVEFAVPGVPIPVIGYIDMISSDGVPCDFKTSSKAWYAAKAHDELQPAFYLLALNQLGQMPESGAFRYYVFTKTKKPKVQIIETRRTFGQLLWTLDMIREAWQGIQASVFPPSGPGSWKCSEKYCEFWNLCRGK